MLIDRETGVPALPGSRPPQPGQTSSIAPKPGSTNAADAVACDPAKVTVEGSTGRDELRHGVNPVLTFTLKSLMTEPCTLAVGSDSQEFKVTSGDELIWSSKDCQTDAVAATTVLMPGCRK